MVESPVQMTLILQFSRTDLRVVTRFVQHRVDGGAGASQGMHPGVMSPNSPIVGKGRVQLGIDAEQILSDIVSDIGTGQGPEKRTPDVQQISHPIRRAGILGILRHDTPSETGVMTGSDMDAATAPRSFVESDGGPNHLKPTLNPRIPEGNSTTINGRRVSRYR